MSGGFDPNNPPTRRGFYNNVIAAATAAITGGTLGVLAVPIKGNSGPIGVVTPITNQKAFDTTFGNTDNDDRFTVLGALAGSGAPGVSGISKVLVYRMPLTGQAFATHVFQNTAGTPANALTVTSKYKGSLANLVSITVQAHPSDNTKDQLLVFLNGQLMETWSYTATSLASLVSQLTSTITGSRYITATVQVDGVALALVSSRALTGGADGTATSADYTTAFSQFESQDFNLFTLPNMTDGPTIAAMQSWVETQNGGQRRIMAVEGGTATEALSDGIARSSLTSANENFANAGFNVFTEQATGNTKSTAQMTGYLAGMIAEAGITSSVTFMRGPAGFDLQVNPTPDQIEAAINGGMLIFSKDAQGIKLENENTTFTLTTNVLKPFDDFSSIKAVRTIHQIDTDLTELTNNSWIGKIANTTETRKNYLGTLLSYFRVLESETALQGGASTVTLDDTEDNTGDTLWPVYTITMTKTIQRVLATGQLVG